MRYACVIEDTGTLRDHTELVLSSRAFYRLELEPTDEFIPTSFSRGLEPVEICSPEHWHLDGHRHWATGL